MDDETGGLSSWRVPRRQRILLVVGLVLIAIAAVGGWFEYGPRLTGPSPEAVREAQREAERERMRLQREEWAAVSQASREQAEQRRRQQREQAQAQFEVELAAQRQSDIEFTHALRQSDQRWTRLPEWVSNVVVDHQNRAWILARGVGIGAASRRSAIQASLEDALAGQNMVIRADSLLVDRAGRYWIWNHGSLVLECHDQGQWRPVELEHPVARPRSDGWPVAVSDVHGNAFFIVGTSREWHVARIDRDFNVHTEPLYERNPEINRASRNPESLQLPRIRATPFGTVEVWTPWRGGEGMVGVLQHAGGSWRWFDQLSERSQDQLVEPVALPNGVLLASPRQGRMQVLRDEHGRLPADPRHHHLDDLYCVHEIQLMQYTPCGRVLMLAQKLTDLTLEQFHEAAILIAHPDGSWSVHPAPDGSQPGGTRRMSSHGHFADAQGRIWHTGRWILDLESGQVRAGYEHEVMNDPDILGQDRAGRFYFRDGSSRFMVFNEHSTPLAPRENEQIWQVSSSRLDAPDSIWATFEGVPVELRRFDPDDGEWERMRSETDALVYIELTTPGGGAIVRISHPSHQRPLWYSRYHFHDGRQWHSASELDELLITSPALARLFSGRWELLHTVHPQGAVWSSDRSRREMHDDREYVIEGPFLVEPRGEFHTLRRIPELMAQMPEQAEVSYRILGAIDGGRGVVGDLSGRVSRPSDHPDIRRYTSTSLGTWKIWWDDGRFTVEQLMTDDGQPGKFPSRGGRPPLMAADGSLWGRVHEDGVRMIGVYQDGVVRYLDRREDPLLFDDAGNLWCRGEITRFYDLVVFDGEQWVTTTMPFRIQTLLKAPSGRIWHIGRDAATELTFATEGVQIIQQVEWATPHEWREAIFDTHDHLWLKLSETHLKRIRIP